MRCFGAFIHDLSINYGDLNSKSCKHLHKNINDFCAENLVSIEFEDMPNIAIKQFKKVFVNVRHVSFLECELGGKWPSVVQWFPNLRRLNLKLVNMDYRSIKKPFRKLKHLSIKSIDCGEFTANEIAADLLDGIHRLKSFEFENPELLSPPMSMEFTELLDLIRIIRRLSKSI